MTETAAAGAAARELDVLHVLPGRLRVRAHALRGQAGPLAELAARVAGIGGVHAVHASPATGSLLVLHEPAATALWQELARIDALLVAPAAPLSAAIARRVAGAQAAADRRVGPFLDVRGLGAVALCAVAVLQVARGHVFMPAATAIWYALDLLQQRERPDRVQPADGRR
jgi:hypothetical protein